MEVESWLRIWTVSQNDRNQHGEESMVHLHFLPYKYSYERVSWKTEWFWHLQETSRIFCLKHFQNWLFLVTNLFCLQTQSVLSFVLSSIRVNRLFDYSKRMSDQKARNLVHETFTRLNECVQQKLQARNKRRFQNGHLTYQYLEPKWLPNSIHN